MAGPNPKKLEAVSKPAGRVSSRVAGGLTPRGQTPTFDCKPFALREALLLADVNDVGDTLFGEGISLKGLTREDSCHRLLLFSGHAT